MQDLPENHFWVSGASWVNINNNYHFLKSDISCSDSFKDVYGISKKLNLLTLLIMLSMENINCEKKAFFIVSRDDLQLWFMKWTVSSKECCIWTVCSVGCRYNFHLSY